MPATPRRHSASPSRARTYKRDHATANAANAANAAEMPIVDEDARATCMALARLCKSAGDRAFNETRAGTPGSLVVAVEMLGDNDFTCKVASAATAVEELLTATDAARCRRPGAAPPLDDAAVDAFGEPGATVVPPLLRWWLTCVSGELNIGADGEPPHAVDLSSEHEGGLYLSRERRAVVSVGSEAYGCVVAGGECTSMWGTLFPEPCPNPRSRAENLGVA
jgi:hypothetical protein